MTAIAATLDHWAETPLGKVTRLTIAVLGVITAILTLMLASVIDDASWVLVLAGVALAATAARAAKDPNLTKLTTVTANLVVIPLLMHVG